MKHTLPTTLCSSDWCSELGSYRSMMKTLELYQTNTSASNKGKVGMFDVSVFVILLQM